RDFYEALVAAAARHGFLSAHVLRLDGKPLAYTLGLASVDGTFLDLKESFVAAHSEHSPGHVLKRYAMQTLLSRGIRLYDFMGACERYKMRWTDKTYRCSTVSIYNRTVRGRYWYWRSRLGRALKGARGGRASPSAQRPAADGAE